MADKQKILKFQELLLLWYEENGRSFSWRKGVKTPYQNIIAEILLQRTNANAVAKFYPAFLKKYPNWKKLGLASKKDLQDTLKPIGLNIQRGERLFQLAQVMKKRRGRLPKERHELEQLPMFGQYIVNACELLVQGKKSPLLDVNMTRVLERIFGPRNLADIRYDPYLQKLAYQLVNIKQSKKINWAILDYAQLVCKARNPKCDTCKLSLFCCYYES